MPPPSDEQLTKCYQSCLYYLTLSIFKRTTFSEYQTLLEKWREIVECNFDEKLIEMTEKNIQLKPLTTNAICERIANRNMKTTKQKEFLDKFNGLEVPHTNCSLCQKGLLSFF